MNRQKLEKYIVDTYGARPEYPWAKYPTFAVFRHGENRKWFAVIMTIDKSKIGLREDGKIDVVNLKCGPDLSASLQEQQGIYPAYHMNKEHWITAALDGSILAESLKLLLAISFDLTDNKNKQNI